LGEWVREAVLKVARSSAGALGADPLMTEIVALQLFLTNVLSPVVCGERMSTEQYQELMRNVKTNKHRAAREVVTRSTLRTTGRKSAMPETNWGRKETIIWPPHMPINTFGAVFLAVMIMTGFFVYMHFAFALAPLESSISRTRSRPPSCPAFAPPASTKCCLCPTKKATPGMSERWMLQRDRRRKQMPSPSR
jgi:hypothetical protein